MQLTSVTLAAASLLAAQATAKLIRVDVGKSGKTFTPDSITADRGDVVEFFFSGSRHNVVAGDFDKGCSPVGSGGFYSGTQQAKGDDPSVFQVNVTSTDPIYFYCSVASHCKDGMVGAINPSSDKPLDKYRSNSKSGSTSPSREFGGKLVRPSEATSPKPAAGEAGALRTSLGALGGLAMVAAAMLD